MGTRARFLREGMYAGGAATIRRSPSPHGGGSFASRIFQMRIPFGSVLVHGSADPHHDIKRYRSCQCGTPSRRAPPSAGGAAPPHEACFRALSSPAASLPWRQGRLIHRAFCLPCGSAGPTCLETSSGLRLVWPFCARRPFLALQPSPVLFPRTQKPAP